ncbi:ABC transporter permease [Anaerocolumna sp. MB42-C2]|uniref:ABC transporter permease n=1 Tax=Anaerocolumna sp. MB42-C2 TaxID=3070997 RepID=UPI0027DFDB54|nr:ABC transporter permease [Anaerocolumna sp. MB42-C2]WMJ90794.1 ABC transporter permease [Anaerocolumna sp. MB42-C2]
MIQSFKLAGRSIISSKMRSFLTMLGMIIGVTSVITLVGLMNGVTNYMLSMFADLGTNSITVQLNNTDTRHVDAEDIYKFVKENSDIFQYVTPQVSGQYTIKNGTESTTTSVSGVSEDFADMNNLDISDGRFIQYSDIKNRYKGCVIGTYIAKELFDSNVKVGDTIKVNGQVYNIIGILKEKADSTQGSSDDCLYIPYTNAVRMSGSANISAYTLSTFNTDLVNNGKYLLDNFTYSIMKNEDLYNISTMAELLDQVNEMTGMLSSILGGIAGISLLVAGIGIMNIMLVSVVERTKEIGIRKSLGAKKKDIMSQFVIEAATISTIGGIIGIIFGWIGTVTLGKAFGLEAVPTIGSIILAFSVSAGIGIGFGYMPANKAAKLNPIDALRSE